jgi:hypothetical protein
LPEVSARKQRFPRSDDLDEEILVVGIATSPLDPLAEHLRIELERLGVGVLVLKTLRDQVRIGCGRHFRLTPAASARTRIIAP